MAAMQAATSSDAALPLTAKPQTNLVLPRDVEWASVPLQRRRANTAVWSAGCGRRGSGIAAGAAAGARPAAAGRGWKYGRVREPRRGWGADADEGDGASVAGSRRGQRRGRGLLRRAGVGSTGARASPGADGAQMRTRAESRPGLRTSARAGFTISCCPIHVRPAFRARVAELGLVALM
jgi:hypothetical protein